MASDQSQDNRTRPVLTAGTEVGHYRIEHHLGAGGMGEVFLARDVELDRKVALKFLPPHMCRDDDCRARFKREAQAAAKLNHPNIVTIHEVSEHQGRPYFAMEYVAGRPLSGLLKQEQLEPFEAVELFLKICEGLQAAHSAGVIHRDIKPSNVAFDAEGRPRLLDFGLAAIRGDQKLTRTGSTLGTVGYMSPEQIQGREADHRSDLFSMGVLLYEMVAGRAPFTAEAEAATMNRIISDAPEPLSRFKSGVPDELQRIVSKLLDKDPGLRYQSAADVVTDLKRLSVGRAASVPGSRTGRWVLAIIAAAAVAAVALWFWQSSTGDSFDGLESLVVLPFENLGAAEDEYFADGMTDEITARLAGFSGLRVISRTSANHYRGSGKSLKQIARELKVDYVLEGTIRWDKSGDTDRVRITPQLIRASDDSHVWANTFERTLTQVFAVQADIASRIAEALDVTLLDSEKEILGAEPTENLEAYDYYLRGRDDWSQGKFTARSVAMFEKAVELDSNFYPALAWLPRVYGYEYINDINMSPERAAMAKRAAERAFRLAEGKPDGFLALGYYHYYISRDYSRALELFQRALDGQPSNSELIAAIAYVQRRMGNWELAVEYLRRSLVLNPISLTEIDGLVHTLLYLHRPDEAAEVIDRGMEFAPDSPNLMFWKGALMFCTGKDTTEIRATLEEYGRRAPAPVAAGWLEMSDIIARDYRSALTRKTGPLRATAADTAEFYLSRGKIYRFMGDTANSRHYFDSARAVTERRVRADPEVALLRADLAEAYAGVGLKQEATEEALCAVELMPVSEDEILGTQMLTSLAEVYILVGEYELAIDQIDYLLGNPSILQVETVRHHPLYDPLRAYPRFEEIIEKYSELHR